MLNLFYIVSSILLKVLAIGFGASFTTSLDELLVLMVLFSEVEVSPATLVSHNFHRGSGGSRSRQRFRCCWKIGAISATVNCFLTASCWLVILSFQAEPNGALKAKHVVTGLNLGFSILVTIRSVT